MKKIILLLLLVSSMSLISCGGQKAVVKSGKSQVDKPKKSFMGSLLSSATSLSEVKAISSPTASLPGANQISVSSGADRKSIELEEIEEPRNLQITTFVSISKVLSLKPGQSYTSVISSIGNPYDILYKNRKGSVYVYYYKTIDSIYDENTENIVGSSRKGQRHRSGLNDVYLEFDSSNNLVRISNENFK
tara:strand:+ start:529 stop:1098 length:570 start_codon:yes stop_codon:yes gene_type:complete